MPLISVVIPTHNRPELLAEAIASVRAQTFTDYEIIVVSNGESTGMRQQSLAAATSFDARYFALDEGNLPAARNFGIEQADGEWIAFLDDDDLWLPEKLRRQTTAAVITGADMVACDNVQFFHDGHEVINQWRVPPGWTWHKAVCHWIWHCIPSSAFVRKSVIIRAGGFDLRQKIHEDDDLWRRLAANGYLFHQITEPLTRYRCGHSNIMAISNSRKRQPYLLRFYFKSYRETPRALRADLPPWHCFVWPALMMMAPGWFHRPHPGLRPRTRLLALKSRIRRLMPATSRHRSAPSP